MVGRGQNRYYTSEEEYVFAIAEALRTEYRAIVDAGFVSRNAADPVLASLPEPARATLLAEPTGGGYRFDVHLQGEHETAFFDV